MHMSGYYLTFPLQIQPSIAHEIDLNVSYVLFIALPYLRPFVPCALSMNKLLTIFGHGCNILDIRCHHFAVYNKSACCVIET